MLFQVLVYLLTSLLKLIMESGAQRFIYLLTMLFVGISLVSLDNKPDDHEEPYFTCVYV